MLLVDRLMRAWLMRGKEDRRVRPLVQVVLRLPSLFQRALRFAIRRALKPEVTLRRPSPPIHTTHLARHPRHPRHPRFTHRRLLVPALR